jgi:hypothetical protein
MKGCRISGPARDKKARLHEEMSMKVAVFFWEGRCEVGVLSADGSEATRPAARQRAREVELARTIRCDSAG